MPSPLERLARTLGHPAPTAAASLLRLDAATGTLLLGDDPRRLAALTELASAAAPTAPLDEITVYLQAQFGAVREVCLTRGAAASRELACASATDATDRVDIALLDKPGERPEDWETLAAVLAPAHWPTSELTSLRETAHQHGALFILDATTSAWRLPHPLDPDFLCLGESMAEGLGCGALLGYGTPLAASAEGPDSLALASALASLRALDGRDLTAPLHDIGMALRTTFERACEDDDIRGRLTGPPAHQTLEFDGQEGAEAPLFDQHFALEMAKFDVEVGRDLIAYLGLDTARATHALAAAVARMRTLLVEFNSYLCGEIPFVFPGGDPILRERGLGRYRFPKLAAVDVDPDGDCMRIDFAPSDSLGAVTSSGFYLPTLITGDFDVSVDYRVTRWALGPDSACLALFAQNEESTARYYAQRMSGSDRPDDHEVLACLDTVLGERTAVEPPNGSFRLTREGSVLRAWHRLDAKQAWQLLDSKQDATTDDVLFGVKIWSKVACGGLTAELRKLVIEGELASEQLPRLEHRDDPRG